MINNVVRVSHTKVLILNPNPTCEMTKIPTLKMQELVPCGRTNPSSNFSPGCAALRSYCGWAQFPLLGIDSLTFALCLTDLTVCEHDSLPARLRLMFSFEMHNRDIFHLVDLSFPNNFSTSVKTS